MATAKRNIREVLDAGFDMTGGEQVDSSNYTGWTTAIYKYYTNLGASTATKIAEYEYYCLSANSSDKYPDQDGLGGGGVLINNNFITILIHIPQTNVGLRHIHQQMQAMKSPPSGYGGDHNSSSPSVSGITGVGNGNGTYKNANISMGDMRGFKYNVFTSNTIWPTTSGTTEYLENTGEISVGSTS